jgi:hypothetical protein
VAEKLREDKGLNAPLERSISTLFSNGAEAMEA